MTCTTSATKHSSAPWRLLSALQWLSVPCLPPPAPLSAAPSGPALAPCSSGGKRTAENSLRMRGRQQPHLRIMHVTHIWRGEHRNFTSTAWCLDRAQSASTLSAPLSGQHKIIVVLAVSICTIQETQAVAAHPLAPPCCPHKVLPALCRGHSFGKSLGAGLDLQHIGRDIQRQSVAAVWHRQHRRVHISSASCAGRSHVLRQMKSGQCRTERVFSSPGSSSTLPTMSSSVCTQAAANCGALRS